MSGDVRSWSTTEADYADVFVLTDGLPGTSAERWARTMFEDVGGWGAQVIWRGLLGMRLHAAPERIAGWEVGHRGVDWVRLDATSWFLTGQMVVQSRDDQVTFATFVRYDRRWARAVWQPLSVAHRRLSPGLLRDAYRLLQAPR